MAKRILVVDDEAAIRELLCDALESQGYEVYSAADGQQARDRLIRGLRPHVLVTDLMMPRMSGGQLLSWMRRDERFKNIAVVVVTAAEPTEPSRLGADMILRKPISMPGLLKTLKAQLSPLQTGSFTISGFHRTLR